MTIKEELHGSSLSIFSQLQDPKDRVQNLEWKQI